MVKDKYFFNKGVFTALFFYILFSGILLFHFGIQTGGEAEKYIDNANRILQGRELRNGFFGIFYVAYSLLIAFFVKFSIPLVFVAVIQLLLSFLAAVSLYHLLVNTLGNSAIAFFFFIAYLLCYPIQKWNFFLYSESVHTSFLLIGVYFFERALRYRNQSNIRAFGCTLLLILFSRPVGLLFLASTALVMLAWVHLNKSKAVFYLFSGISLAIFVFIASSPVTAFVNPDSLKRMEVICQVPGVTNDTAYTEFNRAGLSRVYTVIKNDIGFGNFFEIGFRKLAGFFGMYRPYYSWQNNLLLILHMIFYPFVLIGIFSKQLPGFRDIKRLSLAYLLFTAVAIFFTCDDWANRFISPAFPFILILAAAGFSVLHRKYFSTR